MTNNIIIYSPWNWGICVDFQAILEVLLINPDTHLIK